MDMEVMTFFQSFIVGKEVALFVEKHFINELKKNEDFKKNNFKAALKQTFLRMDELL